MCITELRVVLCKLVSGMTDKEVNCLSEESNANLVRGATSMVAAVFISKMLGILFIIPMQNLIGNYALGIYQLVYPLYTIMLTLATAGFPLALSKTISELSARGEYRRANSMYSIVGRSSLLFGLIGFVIMWFAGPWYLVLTASGHTAQTAAAIPAIHALAPALLLLPLMSAQRGYLQGNMHLGPSAASQVVEQITRVAVVLIGIIIAIHLGSPPAITAAIATFGGTAGAMVAFILLLYAVKKLRKKLTLKARSAVNPHLVPTVVLKQLFIYSMPIAMGTLILPISQTIDAWTVPKELMIGGFTYQAAIAQYGVYAGEALRLMQLPLSFATAIGSSIMPAITEALTKHNWKMGEARLSGALRMTAFITLPAAGAIALLAGPIDLALFKSTSGTTVIAVSAIMSIFSALELVSTYILQGYNRFYQPVLHMGIGALIKLIGNLLLVPILGITGAALASNLGYLTSSWLNMRSIRKASKVPITFPRVAWRAAIATCALSAWLFALVKIYHMMALSLLLMNSRGFALLVILVGLTLGAPLYLLVALWVKATTKNDVRHMPLIGSHLGRFFS